MKNSEIRERVTNYIDKWEESDRFSFISDESLEVDLHNKLLLLWHSLLDIRDQGYCHSALSLVQKMDTVLEKVYNGEDTEEIHDLIDSIAVETLAHPEDFTIQHWYGSINDKTLLDYHWRESEPDNPTEFLGNTPL